MSDFIELKEKEFGYIIRISSIKEVLWNLDTITVSMANGEHYKVKYTEECYDRLTKALK